MGVPFRARWYDCCIRILGLWYGADVCSFQRCCELYMESGFECCHMNVGPFGDLWCLVFQGGTQDHLSSAYQSPSVALRHGQRWSLLIKFVAAEQHGACESSCLPGRASRCISSFSTEQSIWLARTSLSLHSTPPHTHTHGFKDIVITTCH
jgi:hypothetical protein